MDLKILCDEVQRIAKQAGSFIREERKNFSYDAVSDKGTNQLVSFVDITAEKMIVEGLKQLLPGAGFIGEESTNDTAGEKYNWIIDPLDGTTNFIHALPVFAVSIALKENNEIILGVVYEINRDECFYAWKDGGAYLNANKISVSAVPLLKDSLLATGFPYYDFASMQNYLDTLRHLMQHTHGLRRLGSAAADLAYVACGRFEGFFEYGLRSWDVAAGVILVKEAGGRLSDFNGGEDYIFGRKMVAANSGVFDELLAVIRRYFGDWDV